VAPDIGKKLPLVLIIQSISKNRTAKKCGGLENRGEVGSADIPKAKWCRRLGWSPKARLGAYLTIGLNSWAFLAELLGQSRKEALSGGIGTF